MNEVSPYIAPLLKQLNGLRFCHWKSNFNLSRSLTSETDLDILVDQTQQSEFLNIISNYGFKPAKTQRTKDYPGICDYIGFDPDYGKLIHLHVHFKLVLGEQNVKNHRLSLEKAILDSSDFYHGNDIKTISPNHELAIFILRSLLKLRYIDLFLSKINGNHFMPQMINDEYTWLYEKANNFPEELDPEFLLYIPKNIINDYLTYRKDTNTSFFKYYKLKKRLIKHLKDYRRRNSYYEVARYIKAYSSFFYMLAMSILKKIPLIKRKPSKKLGKQLNSGGTSIAFVGSDGAGKSTIIKDVEKWLSKKINTKTYYLGSSKTFLTKAYHYPIVISRGIQKAYQRFPGKNAPGYLTVKTIARFFVAKQMLAYATKRHKEYIKGTKAANNGDIVLFDRFIIRDLFGVMDSPKIWEADDFISRKFATAERSLYENINHCDIIFILHLSAETAIKRKPDHLEEVLRQKCEAVDNIKDHKFYHINSEQPYEEVLKQIKRVIWEKI